jgi:hypothetical protein
MRLKKIGSNMSEVEINGSFVLFSYETPVAGRSIKAPSGDDYEKDGFFKTSTHYSATTTRHINKYFKNEWNIDGKEVEEVSQDFINGLVR